MIKGKAYSSLKNISIIYSLLIICLKAFGISVSLKLNVLMLLEIVFIFKGKKIVRKHTYYPVFHVLRPIKAKAKKI